MVKLLMGWNIIPGREGDYFDYVVEVFQPGLEELGLKTTDVWYTAYGDLPQIVTGAVSSDLASLQEVLRSTRWHDLKEELLQFVTGYRQKVIPANGEYQL
ncbi:MAG: hypothetical protein JW900_09370 [Anaerolineae bacterium]|nr:hypothetical protein [Anaerolineae bacterium]